MKVKRLLLFLLLFAGKLCSAQQHQDSLLKDTTVYDFDEIFSELDALLDSLNTPRSFWLANLSFGSSYFTYLSKSGVVAKTKQQFTYAPTMGYFDKNGFGLSATASLANDGTTLTPYQYAVTGSYDYLKKKQLITGLSLTHFFTKKDVSFYTSPLQNELYGYFTLRKLWLKPLVAASYGWGNREAYEQREAYIQNLQLAQNGFTRINTKEKIIDFNLIASVRHDVYFLDVFSKNDFIRLTPQLSFVSGTQQFGFNQTSSTYVVQRRSGANVLYNTQDITLDNNLYFQPLSLTGYIKTEYSKGKFFFQPQVVFDYYFPASSGNFTTSFLVNSGFVF